MTVHLSFMKHSHRSIDEIGKLPIKQPDARLELLVILERAFHDRRSKKDRRGEVSIEAEPDIMLHDLPPSRVSHLITLAEVNDASLQPHGTGKLDEVLALLHYALRGIKHPDDSFVAGKGGRVFHGGVGAVEIREVGNEDVEVADPDCEWLFRRKCVERVSREVLVAFH